MPQSADCILRHTSVYIWPQLISLLVNHTQTTPWCHQDFPACPGIRRHSLSVLHLCSVGWGHKGVPFQHHTELQSSGRSSVLRVWWRSFLSLFVFRKGDQDRRGIELRTSQFSLWECTRAKMWATGGDSKHLYECISLGIGEQTDDWNPTRGN